ncbi:MAG: hypothetical protein M3Z24_01025 [Chloroflexota bacterium]|nr:hypothetical protein [Chloroflexota bacterium]
MEHSNNQVSQVQPLDEIYWRDEILQVMYWYRGEGFGEALTVQDLQTFLPADEYLLATQMEAMVVDGYLVREGNGSVPRYGFTEYGATEGARRFADEFAGLTGQAHGECGPDCPHCKGIARDSCVHCASA